MNKNILHLSIPNLHSNYISINGIRLHSSIDTRLLNNAIFKEISNKAAIFKKMKNCRNYADIVGYLSGFEFIYTDNDLGGYCDLINDSIALNANGDKKLHIPILCHEIAHSIQRELGFYSINTDVITKAIHLEQQAETIAFYLHKNLFNYADRSKFNSYMNKSDWLWLTNYYNGFIENDLIWQFQIFFVFLYHKSQTNAVYN